MTAIGIPSRPSGEWDVPASQVADEMTALKARAAAEEREQQQRADMAALVARQKRQARAERLERKRTEHLRGRLPLDDPDRHDIDRVDSYFVSTAASFPTPATDADYAGTPWAAWLADQIAKNKQPGRAS